MIDELIRRARSAVRRRADGEKPSGSTGGAPPPRVETRPARDSQRSAVYAWERRLPGWPGERLSLADCQERVRAVWEEHLSGPAPRVTDGRGRRSACYAPGNHQIRLPRAARRHFIVLHEIVHGLLARSQPEVAYHGPEFARLYLSLLHRHAGVPLNVARRLAAHQKPRKVHFARLRDVLAPLSEEKREPAPVAGEDGQPLLF